MAAQNTKMKNIMTTVGLPKLWASTCCGGRPPMSASASMPAMLGQMISMNIQPYSTPRKMLMSAMPCAMSGGYGGSSLTPNMTARQTREWNR